MNNKAILHLAGIPRAMNAVNLLNEISSLYPEAISFTSGSPQADRYRLDRYSHYIERFVTRHTIEQGWQTANTFSLLGNYSSAMGITRHYIRQHLATDDNLEVEEDQIVITNGAQEAILLTLQALFKRQKPGSLVISTPFYSGVDAAARMLGIETHYLQESEFGLTPEALLSLLDTETESANPVRAVYCCPNFSNPSGTLMPDKTKERLVELCRNKNILLIEDNTYGYIGYGDPFRPAKAWDTTNHVIYISTFSKTICPGIRAGYVVTGQTTMIDGTHSSLAQVISTYKSLGSNHVPGLIQALIGGILEENYFSVRGYIAEQVTIYRAKRDHLIYCLREYFGARSDVSWTEPQGGFFCVVTLPFFVDEDAMHTCATRFRVIWLPMSMFMPAGSISQKIRLSFSNVSAEQIQEGVKRLAEYVSWTIKEK
ncbi:PLP-dependent aminotransferase family protein [Vibrio maritimus]|uniref:aminotransferase-like domain-containing protein n=1 Tax=Vibrio maritimus TaxID=990268 RepID=UPI001F2F42D1|nr:PLP-dependent aminotransferase family protein [Vibrio maritimus]